MSQNLRTPRKFRPLVSKRGEAAKDPTAFTAVVNEIGSYKRRSRVSFGRVVDVGDRVNVAETETARRRVGKSTNTFAYWYWILVNH